MAEGDRTTGPASVDAYRHRLGHLRTVGGQLRAAVARSPDSPSHLETVRRWQQECASTVSQLSGGSKTHWLSRAFSSALLVPTAGAESAGVATIVGRILEVLASADRSLSDGAALAVPGAAATREARQPPPRPRFEMIRQDALRSGLERAYLDGQDALARGEVALALMTFCSILETIVTDALERCGPGRLSPYAPPAEPLVNWPFPTRIAMAERAGIISRGCARLPEAAYRYRDGLDRPVPATGPGEISLRDAKLTSDVLHVILRDLAPGR
jgi:hypothetical protein